jgi:putative ABC transport system permease protein
MLALALSTVRARRVAFAGAVIAITLGVTLVCATALLMANALASSGAGRFGAVDAVVMADSSITVGHGDSASAVTVHPPPRLPAELVSAAAKVDGVGRAVGDLAFPATAVDARGRILSAAGADRTEAHGWASAALTPYMLAAGRAPTRVDEVVVDTRLANAGRVRVGQRLRVVVPAGTRAFRVSGLAAAPAHGDRGQSALFFADQTAAELADTLGQVNAIGIFAEASTRPDVLRTRLQARLGDSVKVLSRRRAADADAGDPRSAQREDVIAFLGTLGALAAVIAVFIVASTFAFTITQRRRELALLRAVGATPQQVRRMIAAEALVLAAIGGVPGCAAGLPLADAIGRGLVWHGVAPQGLHADPNAIALLIAFASGVLIAELAVLAAARRAARIRPAEALLEAAIEPRGLGVARWLLGLAALGGAAAMFALFGGDNANSFAEVTALLLAIALALLSPLLLALPATLLSWPLRFRASGFLASAAMATHRRRVGAVAAPLVLLVALAGSYAISDATTRAATQDTTANRTRAPFVVVARAGEGLPLSAASITRRLPGVTAAVGTVPTQVYLLDSGLDNYGSAWDSAGIDRTEVGPLLDLQVQAGSLAALRGNTIAVSRALANHRGLRAGALLHARLADTTLAELRVGAIYGRALGLGDVLLPAPLAERHASDKLANAVFFATPRLSRTILARLNSELPTARVLTRSEYLAGIHAAGRTSAWIVWLIIGLTAAFAGIAVVNTSVIATADRRHELALLRLIGATREQARNMIGWEALLTTLVGVGAGALAARLAVARILEGQPGWRVVVPPVQLGSILAGAAILGLLGSLVPARIALHSRVDVATERSE